ncbi:ATP-binding protein [Erythrobacter sp.]|uniref:ATP-binding protein n=1 Tax=Erythrobacter sp. TaxID=1042 RepID=UPI0025D6C98A|nr:ATP-binding protein [Erythrobacter sp.]
MTDLISTTTLASTSAPTLPPKPKKKRKLKVIIIGPNGGGVRKTKTALAIGSVATAAGLVVIYVCADRGIGSLSTSLKVGGPNRVELLPDEETGNYADTLIALADEAGADVIIIDLGANEMLNSKSRRTVRAALRQMRALGHDTFAVLSLVPGKVGLEDDAANFARQISKEAEVLVAVHGQDEGCDLSKFDELRHDFPSIAVLTDQLAILSLITAAGVTPFDWCAKPVAGFELAAAWTAHNLMELAKQPGMVYLVHGDLAVPVLAALARGRLVPSYSGRNLKWQVSNECLVADAREITSQRNLLRLAPDADDPAVLVAARAFIVAAKEAALAAHRAAAAAM